MQNLLFNGGFEGSWREVGGVGELKVSEGWLPWWDPKAARPEYKIAVLDVHARRIHSGQKAQQWFNSYNVHTAGIYQQVNGIVPGRALSCSAWVQCFSRNDDTTFDESAGRYRMRIGIDPYGGTDPESSDVVWSGGGGAIQPYDEYACLEVGCTAKSDRCTVFVWGQAEWPLKHNNAYCDDCELVMLGEPEPEPGEPEPGAGVTAAEVRAIVHDEVRAALRALEAHVIYTVPSPSPAALESSASWHPGTWPRSLDGLPY